MSEKQNGQRKKKMPAITRAMIKQHFGLEGRAPNSRYRCLHCGAEGRRVVYCENANDPQRVVLDLAQHLEDYHDVYMGLDD